MRNLKTVCYCICMAASTLLIGCATSKSSRSTYTKNNKRIPAFIDSISINGSKTPLRTEFEGTITPAKAPFTVQVLQSKYGLMLGVLPQSVKSYSLYAFIEEWYGVHYQMGGSDKAGIDCSAFAQRLYENVFGISLLRTAFDQFNSVKYIWSKDSLMEGDLVFFGKGKHISHVGIYLMNNYFVHASTSGGVMISSLNEEYWQRRYAGAGYVNKNKS